jgi:hypothetical protein
MTNEYNYYQWIVRYNYFGNSSYAAYWIFMKRYTFVVHYLQMCMKEYCCCLKFRKGDNSTYTFTKRGGRVPCKPMPPPPFHESISWIISTFKFWTATIFLHAHLQVVYYKCVKFHKNSYKRNSLYFYLCFLFHLQFFLHFLYKSELFTMIFLYLIQISLNIIINII